MQRIAGGEGAEHMQTSEPMQTKGLTGLLVVLSMLAMAIAGCTSMRQPPGTESTPVVLVAGATGGTGQAVVDQALARGYRVRALVRDETKARMLFGDRVQYVVGDVRVPRTLRKAVRGADQVVSALGANVQRDPQNSPERVDYLGVKALADAAHTAGVSQFILVSSMGVTHPDHQLNAMLDNVLSWKLKGEDAVRAMGIHYTIVRPAELTNEPGGRRGVRIMQGDPIDGEGTISRSDVAAVLVDAIGREDLYDTTFEIVGDHARPRIEWASLYNNLHPDVR